MTRAARRKLRAELAYQEGVAIRDPLAVRWAEAEYTEAAQSVARQEQGAGRG